MEKKYYDEKLYLLGDKDAINEILKLRNEYSLLYVLERQKNAEVLKLYNRYLRMLRDFFKTLDLDDSLEYSIALYYLIKNGYLTVNKEFKDTEIKDEIHTRYGVSIIRGYGVCRNYCDINKDILHLLDYFVKNIYCYCPTFSLPNSARLKKSNHVINLIEYDGVKYGIDLFNNCHLYRFKSAFILDRITSKNTCQMRYKPYFEVIVGDSSLEEVCYQVKEYDLESKKETISPVDYELGIRKRIINYMNSNKELLDDFHEETNDIKKEIVLKLTN